MKKLIFVSMGLLLGACDGNNESNTGTQSGAVKVERHQDFAQIQRGGRIYQQNCAQCHGTQGEGDPNWRQRDTQGMFPPPPLNGTAHTWHHPMAVLKHVITNGSPQGKGRMPAWGGKLSEQEIEDVIAWFQAKWPDEVYAAWYEMDQRARSR